MKCGDQKFVVTFEQFIAINNEQFYNALQNCASGQQDLKI